MYMVVRLLTNLSTDKQERNTKEEEDEASLIKKQNHFILVFSSFAITPSK
jgi:hypothetical protein